MNRRGSHSCSGKRAPAGRSARDSSRLPIMNAAFPDSPHSGRTSLQSPARRLISRSTVDGVGFFFTSGNRAHRSWLVLTAASRRPWVKRDDVILMTRGNVHLIKDDDTVGGGIVESGDEMGILGNNDPVVRQL